MAAPTRVIALYVKCRQRNPMTTVRYMWSKEIKMSPTAWGRNKTKNISQMASELTEVPTS